MIAPSFRDPELLKGCYSIPKEAYVIHELDGKYKLYVGEEYWFTLINREVAEDWPIYERCEE